MIRNVVFDIGGVLLRLRYQPFIDYLASAGIDMTDLPAWLQRVDLSAHERGEISGEELLGRVAAMAARPLDPAELRARWLDMFDRAQEMFDLASGLMGDYRVYLLSNIGDLHWRHLDALYGLEALTHGVIGSTARPNGASTSTPRRRCSSTTCRRTSRAPRPAAGGRSITAARPRRASGCGRSACACPRPSPWSDACKQFP